MNLVTRLFRVLTPAQRRRYLALQVWFIFAAFVQMAGVGSVAPFIALLSNQSNIHKNAIGQRLYDLLGAHSDTQFLIYFAVLLMAIIVFSNLVGALTVFMSIGFSQRLGVELQHDIYRGHLYRDYVELARINTNDLVATMTQHAPRFIYMIVQPLLDLTSQLFVVVLIVSGLIWYDVTVALVASLLVGGSYAIVFAFLRRQMTKSGTMAAKGMRSRLRLLTESLGGIKEIRLFGSEREYEARLLGNITEVMRAEKVLLALGDIPRFLLESIALCALLSLGIFLLRDERSSNNIVGILSLYAMAGYKILPAAQNVFKSASQIRANWVVVEVLEHDIAPGRAVIGEQPVARVVAPPPIDDIVFDSVCFRYPNTSEDVIKSLSLRIRRNTIAVLVGASGAGKSTAADLLLGFLRPDRGSVRMGDRTSVADPRSWQRNLGYVPQSIFLLDDSIGTNITFGTHDEVDVRKLERAAAMSNIDSFVNSLPGRYDYNVGERGALLSGGQRQRIGLARALYHDAEILVLDEATSALDTITERDIIATLLELKKQKTIVMIAHRLSTIRCADQIIVMNDGTLSDQGTYDELMARSPEFRAIVAAGGSDSADTTLSAASSGR